MNKVLLTAWRTVLLCATAGLLLLDGCAGSLSNTPAQEEKLVVKITLHDWHQLFVELHNATDNPLELNTTSLPWGWRYSMWVKAFENDVGGSPLDERLTLADPPIIKEKVILLPGKPLKGNIDLRERFPELEDVLRRRDVIIFWSYVPEMARGDVDQRFFGSLMIPKF